MRLSTLTCGLLAVLVPVCAAWSKEDREIFRVRDELAAVLGPDVTFYDFLRVPPSASIDDINKAYRKRSRALHPDKVKQQLAAERAKSQKAKDAGKGSMPKPLTAAEVRAAVNKASDMQARLSIVANILRGPDRDRYDHFLSNGFPVWKGTEYYYNRYRPGFGTVLFGLFLFVGGGAHYLVLYTSWKRRREFVERYIRSARQKAWGTSSVAPGVLGGLDGLGGEGGDLAPADPASVNVGQQQQQQQQQQAVAVNRKQRRMQERDAKREAARESDSAGRRGRRGGAAAAATAERAGSRGSGTATPTRQPGAQSGPTGAKKRVVAENGKVLVVDSLGDVYLEEVDEEGNIEELLLDVNEVARPTFRETAVYRLPAWAYGATVGRFLLSEKSAAGGDAAAGSSSPDNDENEDSSSSDAAGKATPSSDSNDEFELLEKPAGSGAGSPLAKTTGANSNNNRNKASKRKGKKK